MDKRNQQPLQAVVSNSDDAKIQFIQEFGTMCLYMGGRQCKREKQLSKDSAVVLHHKMSRYSGN